MSKEDKAAPATEVEVIQLTPQEFCARLSETVRKPELIAGFEYAQRVAGNAKRSEAEFRAAFEAFLSTPV